MLTKIGIYSDNVLKKQIKYEMFKLQKANK